MAGSPPLAQGCFLDIFLVYRPCPGPCPGPGHVHVLPYITHTTYELNIGRHLVLCSGTYLIYISHTIYNRSSGIEGGGEGFSSIVYKR